MATSTPLATFTATSLSNSETVLSHPTIANNLQLTMAIIALCSCSLIHAYMLINVFPYAALMAVHLLPDGSVDDQSVGPFSGVLASSFMFGRMFSSYPWGRMADLYGRTLVLIASLSLSSVCSLLFGMSQSFTAAMIFRFLLGVNNGLVGTVKTLVSELAPSETVETKIMGLVVGMRACGFFVGPAVGGLLADPIHQFPSSFSNKTHAWYYAALSRYPFLLPNVMGSLLCLTTALLVWWWIPETLTVNQVRPREKRGCIIKDLNKILHKMTRGSKSQRGEVQQNTTEESLLLERHETSNYTNDSRKTDIRAAPMKSIWNIESARRHLLPYWIFSMAVACLDEAFPLFCIASATSGLALAEKTIGEILSSAGLLFLLFQYHVYVQTVERVGLYKSLWFGCFLGFLPVFLIPLGRLLQHPPEEDDQAAVENFAPLGWATFSLLVSAMSLSKIGCCIFFSSISIALNKSVPIELRATLNGFASLVGSIYKGLGPILAGILSQFCFSLGLGELGSIALFSCIGCAGLSTIVFLVGLGPKNANKEAKVSPLV
ncbi:major facilitator superfamily multidrug efflux transporter [Nitzschia inconspicua]|uniref:Major facilitator superfamily multidrug efflux transporter n=1 Tax=Nitzschia inconspicua TaxID=303405 RepID=A0A9K3PUP4_9STRA|nr:major facilitator superfamily multidrug efflux transporter [Nitzschia inconspicua]